MKKVVLSLLILLSVVLLTAQNAPSYLVRLNRQAVNAYFSPSESESLWQFLPKQIEVYYTSENYLLASADDEILTKLPALSFTVLEQLPLTENFFLLSSLPNQKAEVTPAMGIEVTKLDDVILLKTQLTETQLSSLTKFPFVKLDFQPIRLNKSKLEAPKSTRINFGNLLTMVNADSVEWFMQHLQDFGTRYDRSAIRWQVANWIKSQFQRMGLGNAHLESFSDNNGLEHYNVVATLTGTINPEKIIVVGGHHDSIVYGESDPFIFAPGADDNASGATAALEMARVMTAAGYQPECSIRFITFAAEELGLWGSHFYANQAADNEQDIKLMINHDMISNCPSTSTEWNVRLNVYEGSLEQAMLAGSITDAQTVLTPYYLGWNSPSSDSYSFWQRGFPVIYFSEDVFSPYYHTVNDLVANTNPAYAAEVIKASTAACATFDQMPSPVKNVQVFDTGTGNSLLITWSIEGLESDVNHFELYATNPNLQTPLEFSTVTNIFTVPGLESGTEYTIGVAAVDNDLNIGFYTTVNATPNSVPKTPVGLTDFPQLHSIRLTWQPNHELDLTGYRIYRSTSLDGPYAVLNSNLVTDTVYTDQTATDLIYYYYKLAAVDTEANESPLTQAVRSRIITLNQGILIVDETKNNPSNTVFSPNDAVSDAFYEEVLHNFTHAQYDTELEDTLKLADFGIYSSILWHGNDAGNLLYPYAVRDELVKYIQIGGKVLITSYFPARAFDNNGNYPYTYESGSFMFDNFGVQTTDYKSGARFRYALPENSGYPPLTVDSLKTIPPLVGHIYNIESVGAEPTAENVYFYGSDYQNTSTQGSMNGMPVGIYKDHGNGKTVLLSFPLFNMKQDEVSNLIYHVFHNVFGETVSAQDENIVPVHGLHFTKIYPNPCRNYLCADLISGDKSASMQAAIYNVKGQKIRTLYSGVPQKECQTLYWNGKDEYGNDAATGIYFLQAKQKGKTAVRKLVKVK